MKGGSEDYYKHTIAGGYDFHLEEGKNCGPSCTKILWNASGYYSTNLFTERAVDVIDAHDANDPMFMYLAYQGSAQLFTSPLIIEGVHEPREAPVSYWGQYNDTIKDMGRRVFAGMLSAVDEGDSMLLIFP